MLSKKEIEYLSNRRSFSKEYQYVMKTRLREKLKTVYTELCLCRRQQTTWTDKEAKDWNEFMDVIRCL